MATGIIILTLIELFVIIINFEVNRVKLDVEKILDNQEKILDNQKEIFKIISYDSNMIRSHIMNAGAEKPIDK